MTQAIESTSHKLTPTFTTMPEGLKQAWVNALRSGEYKQDVSFLCTEKGYCCLGVLQMVAEGEVEKDSFGCSRALPTHEWMTEHGVVNITGGRIPTVTYEDNTYHLTELNDCMKLSFKQIADLIETNIKGV